MTAKTKKKSTPPSWRRRGKFWCRARSSVGAGQEIIQQRVPEEAIDYREDQDADADDPVGLARMAEATGENTRIGYALGLIFGTFFLPIGLGLIFATVIGMARESEISDLHYVPTDHMGTAGHEARTGFSDQVKK